MKNKNAIKLFTHDDLDGYAAEVLLSLILKKKYKLDVTHLSNEEVNKEIGEFVNNDELYQKYRFIFIVDICPTDVSIINKIKERNYHFSYGMKIFIFDHHKTASIFSSKNEGFFIDSSGDDCGTSALYIYINKYPIPEIEIFIKECVKSSYIEYRPVSNSIPEKKSKKLLSLQSFIYDVYNWDTFNWKEYKKESIDATSAYNLNLLFNHYMKNGNNTRFGDFVEVISCLIKKGIYDLVTMNDNFITLEKRKIEESYNQLMQCVDYYHKECYHSEELDDIVILGYPFKVIPCSEKDNPSIISDIFYDKLTPEDRDKVGLLFIFPEEYTIVGTKYGVSLRSSGDIIDVSEVARGVFHGGGHFNASGGIIRTNDLMNINSTLVEILNGEVYSNYLDTRK